MVAIAYCCRYLLLPLPTVAVAYCCLCLQLPLPTVVFAYCCRCLLLPLPTVAIVTVYHCIPLALTPQCRMLALTLRRRIAPAERYHFTPRGKCSSRPPGGKCSPGPPGGKRARNEVTREMSTPTRKLLSMDPTTETRVLTPDKESLSKIPTNPRSVGAQPLNERSEEAT